MFIPYEFIGIFFLVLMASVWFNHRIGYKKGVSHAYYLGIENTIKYLSKPDILDLKYTHTETGKTASLKETAIWVHNRTLDEFKKYN